VRAGWVRDDDYLLFAVRDGIINRLVHVLPDASDVGRFKCEIMDRYGVYSSRVEVILYNDLEAEMPEPQMICYAVLSPTIEKTHLIHNLQSAGASRDLIERSLQAHRDARCRQAGEDSFFFPYNSRSDPTGSGAWLYHGSPMLDLERLVPEPGRPIFVSPVAAFAACYGLDLQNEVGWIQGTDVFTNEEPFVYIAVPAGRERDLERPCALYRVAESAADFKASGAVSKYEFACNKDIPVVDVTNFATVAEALAHHGVRVFRKGLDLIGDPALLGVLDKERAATETFFELGIEDIRALPFYGQLLYAFFVGCKGYPQSQFSPHYRAVWMRLLTRLLLPTLGPFSQQPVTGYHGFSHSVLVARDALALAIEHGENPLPVMIACLLHDAARVNDEDEKEHAHIGAMLAQEVLSHRLSNWMTSENIQRVVDAVRGHVNDDAPSDGVACCLNDADRLRLAWERGYETRFFATPAGARLANEGMDFTSNWIGTRLRSAPTELKFEVTAACDLHCDFCHRRGVSEKSGPMALSSFKAHLDEAVATGIRSVRLTGGEPFLHKDLRQFGEAARQKNLEVVVNTNATAVPSAYMLGFADFVDCYKISLPGFDESSTTLATGNKNAWTRKVEALGELYGHGCRVEALTVMTSANIRHFEKFLELLSPLENLRWVPLRPESTPFNLKPITISELNDLANQIDVARAASSRWADLQLHLAVPFCSIEDTELACRVFKGRIGCGPADSLTITTQGNIIACYSRRLPLPRSEGLAAIWRRTFNQEFDQLPMLCQTCAFGLRCLGGCRCQWSVIDTAHGSLDYLANPARASSWSSQ
jgi:radical SAM protein with 4Fe4S-binding SPASM domain